MAAFDERYLFGHRTLRPSAQAFQSNVVTHNERRYRFTETWFAADPRLALGGPTLGGPAGRTSMSLALTPGYLERIELPAWC